MILKGYNPYGPHTPSTSEACDVPLAIIEAAQAIKADCLSADGRTAYRIRMGTVEEAYWNEAERNFDSWWMMPNIDDFPSGAVRLE